MLVRVRRLEFPLLRKSLAPGKEISTEIAPWHNVVSFFLGANKLQRTLAPRNFVPLPAEKGNTMRNDFGRNVPRIRSSRFFLFGSTLLMLSQASISAQEKTKPVDVNITGRIVESDPKDAVRLMPCKIHVLK